MQRQLFVIPVAEYGALFHGNEWRAFNREVGTLKFLLAWRSVDSVPRIPVLPTVESSQLFRSQVAFFSFAGDSGVRFITRHAQDAVPTENREVFYTFQGFTDDGKYFVAFFAPVNVTGLPAAKTIGEGTEFIDARGPADFTPGLQTLDKIVKTLKINGVGR